MAFIIVNNFLDSCLSVSVMIISSEVGNQTLRGSLFQRLNQPENQPVCQASDFLILQSVGYTATNQRPSAK